MTAPVASIGVPLRKAIVAALRDHFADLSGFNGAAVAEQKTVVSFGYDYTNLHREQVYTGRCRADTPPAGQRSGRNTRNETGRLDLNVHVRGVAARDVDPTEAAVERAGEIGGEIESWFADRKNGEGLDVDGLQTLVVESLADDYGKAENGITATRTYVVRWTARLE